MKTKPLVLALSAILVVSLSTAPAYGQMMTGETTPILAPITVSTDKPEYATGDTIVVNGMVARGGDGAVSIQVIGPDPSQNRVSVAQVMLNIDRTFEAEFIAGGPLMGTDGTYTVRAQYGSVNSAEATTTFAYTAVPESDVLDPDAQQPPPPTPPVEAAPNIGETTITLEGTDDMIQYEMSGGRILSVTPQVDSSSLLIVIETTDDGSLTMTIPRTILDAKNGEMDTDLFVLIDGEEMQFDEERTDADRTLVIEFMHGTEEIEIFGTFVIPEFGVIAVMILAVAIVSIIAISARSRLGMVQRF